MEKYLYFNHLFKLKFKSNLDNSYLEMQLFIHILILLLFISYLLQEFTPLIQILTYYNTTSFSIMFNKTEKNYAILFDKLNYNLDVGEKNKI